MLRSKIEVYLHMNWATYQREPRIAEDIERRLHRCIASEAISMGCKVLAINGMPDHVHLVVKIPSTISIAALAKQVKGASSTLARERLCSGGVFGWQDRYAAFSISPWDVKKVVEYVLIQKKQHAEGSLIPQLEKCEVDESAAS